MPVSRLHPFLAAAALLCSAPPALGAPAAEADTSSATRARTVILVHGAFADGSSWSGVTALLQRDGYSVIVVQNPLTSLDDDVAATRRAIESAEGPVVLAGHSWGGEVISQAGTDPKVKALVYVAALAPEIGEDFFALAKSYAPSPGLATMRTTDGWGVLSEEGFVANFAQDVPATQARTLAAAQGPVAPGLFGGRTTVAAWKTKPSFYAVSAMDRMIDPALQRFVAKRIGATTVELRASHASPVSQPDAIARLIERAANSAPR